MKWLCQNECFDAAFLFVGINKKDSILPFSKKHTTFFSKAYYLFPKSILPFPDVVNAYPKTHQQTKDIEIPTTSGVVLVNY